MPDFGPAILKTAGFGYDGKGQYRVQTLRRSREPHGMRWAVRKRCSKRVVDFEAELSVVGVRGADGACVFYAPSCNQHVAGILDVSYRARAVRAARRRRNATAITRGILEQLDVTGVLVRGVLSDARWRAAGERTGAAAA